MTCSRAPLGPASRAGAAWGDHVRPHSGGQCADMRGILGRELELEHRSLDRRYGVIATDAGAMV